MNTNQELRETARRMVAPGQGVLAIDETPGTCTKRFVAAGIESTEESRRDYRELLCTAPGLSEYVSGAILVNETIRQRTSTGRSFPEALRENGVIPGIKVDTGAKPLAKADGETVTEGLDNLGDRLAEYREMGARFTKWRAVLRIGPGLPSRYCVHANAHALGRYAAVAQEAGMVPIVEPEVLMDGDHDAARDQDVTEEVLRAVFEQLALCRVDLEAIVLKPNMVTPGKDSGQRMDPEDVAERTLETFLRVVPAAVPGIAFLSGGQTGEEACRNLDAMARRGNLPWHLTYSFGRALQYPALEIWNGEPGKVREGQAALLHRARMSSLASTGRYSPELEREFAAPVS